MTVLTFRYDFSQRKIRDTSVIPEGQPDHRAAGQYTRIIISHLSVLNNKGGLDER